MVTLNKIYTRTGDDGDTVLGTGARVPKFSPRVAAYGTVDEVNATVGLARCHAQAEFDVSLLLIQNDLFDLGADLCVPDEPTATETTTTALRIVAKQVVRLEAEIDQMNDHLQPLNSFILPGGSALSSHLQLCRTVTRRAERIVVELAAKEPVNPNAAKYLNRLSDWFFVASRIANDQGREDVLWTPGANR